VTQAAVFDVDTTNDDPSATACTDAANDCSLRGAILNANTLSEASTINAPAGTYVLSQSGTCTYRVKDSSPGIFTTSQIPLCLSKQIAIQGAGAASTIIDGNQQGHVLFVSADAVAEVRGLTLTNGIGSGFVTNQSGGGGIQNHGTLTLTETVVRDNTLPAGLGAGIHNVGSLTLRRSTVTNNSSSNAEGGGIYNDGLLGGVLTVSESTISNNAVSSHGGGILNRGTATIINSTISGNTTAISGLGGGIGNFGAGNFTAKLTVINSTISGNTSGTSGGGIYNHAGTTVHLNNVTITKNTAGVNSVRGGGGINNGSDGVFTLQNTLIAGNRDLGLLPAPDCSAGVVTSPLTSQGYNLIQDATNCIFNGDTTGNLTGVDPFLGSLADNGGPTQTHALLADSPAIDAGRPAPVPGDGGVACAATDQRGFLRPLGAACDIGAYERFQDESSLHILPKTGGNAGSVTALVYGFNITGGATVKLSRGGEPAIVGNPVGLGGASILSTSFDLTGRPTGPWDVVVTSSDGTSATLPGGFTIEEGRAPELWTDILGLLRPRIGRPARFTVFFGNRGNVDAVGVPLTLSVPAGYAFSVFFSFTPPPPQAGQARDDWSQVPVTVQTDEPSGFANVPLFLPVIPAGFTGSLQIELTPPEDGPLSSLILANFGDPIFNPDLDPEVVSNGVAGAQAYLQGFDVTIPSALIPDLEQYATTQYQQVVERGRTAFIASLGTQLQMYSISHLHFDLVFFAAAQSAESPQASATPEATSDWLSATSRFLIALLSKLGPAEAEAQGQASPAVPCTGGVIGEGESCTPAEKIFPPDIPPPPGCNLKDPSTFKKCKPTEDHCNALGTHKVVKTSDGAFCTPEKPPRNCPRGNIDNPLLGTGNAACKIWPIAPRGSIDPNDKMGSLGVTPAQFLVSATPLSYAVFFENLETATAAAQEVVITDQLDVNTMDLDTFSLGPISFGDITAVPAPGVQQYTGGVDLRPERNLIVTIHASLDKNTGVLTWRFTSIDPDTGQLTEDPDAGFLPPNVNPPEGDGSVVFTVEPKAGLATNTTICNQASIVFDVNEPIVTPEWCNTIDDTPPSSQVLALAPTQSSPSFPVEWSGTDTGSGIADYTIFVSENGGPFTAFLIDTPDTSAMFTGQTGKTYAFYSVARDAVGHEEEPPPTADTQTVIAGLDQCPDDPDKTEPGVCGCGVADTDSDGDSTPDCNDGCSNDPNKTAPGVCGCGVADTDSDSDGTPDCNDGCPTDPSKNALGICGCGVADTDSDGDGTPNCNDACPNDPQNDVDGDGVCGNVDNCPDDSNSDQADADGDGIGDVCEEVTFQFSGFFPPVDNLPTMNVVKAGSAVPMKFSLNGNHGLDIFAVGYPKSQAIACDSTSPPDSIEETVTAGSSSLSYDASTDQYIYVWKTSKSWAGNCRQLVIELSDGSSHMANFKFTK
jgi:hypothetical protein